MKPFLIKANSLPNQQTGFGMIEVLVSLVILLIGLLGLAGLMMQGQRSEMESYQRVQALILLQDMAGRINANRRVARCYAFTTGAGTPYVGYQGTLPATCATGTAAQNSRVATDIAAWDDLLKGAAETVGTSKVGAMVDARGCIRYNSATELNNTTTGAVIPGTGIYTIEVTWQGLGPTFANTTSMCATTLYGNENLRRVAPLSFRIGSLT